jgi:polysaccharide deacetylase 2 family uncharacterized protein YibQ
MAMTGSAGVERLLRTARDGMPLLLAFGYALALGSALLTLLGILLFGRARDGLPMADLAMPERNAAAPRVEVAASTPPPPTVTQPVSTAPAKPAPAPAPQPVPLPKPLAAVTAPPGKPPAAAKPGPAPLPLPFPAPQPPARQVVRAGDNLVADPALIETVPEGPLPRVGADGRTPMTAYAAATGRAKGKRIAIVIDGLGLSARQTQSAIEDLPAAVTLAFAPYESDVQHWVSEARRRGHEVLLEVPMEPDDFPDSDPGPHTLRATASQASNAQHLVWALSRFTGYAGVTNLLGGRFLADSDSLSPVMAAIAHRGLLFFDNAPPARSAAPEVARHLHAPYVESVMTLDTVQSPAEIDGRLAAVEQLARTNGSAAAQGYVTPVTVARVGLWAKGLEKRGFVLVPASAIVSRQ